MKTFILIYWLLTPSGASIATGTAEFIGRDSCEIAWNGIALAAGNPSGRSGHICVSR